jgi:hypothetical protein
MKVWPETRTTTQAMDATMLVVEATRYLEIVDLFRSLGLAVTWRSEATKSEYRGARESCSGPRWRALRRPARANQRGHICFQM